MKHNGIRLDNIFIKGEEVKIGWIGEEGEERDDLYMIGIMGYVMTCFQLPS
jgi:hypothetical protein